MVQKAKFAYAGVALLSWSAAGLASGACSLEGDLKEGRYSDPQKEACAAVEKARAFGPRDARLAAALESLGHVEMLLDKYGDAKEHFDQALVTRWQADQRDMRAIFRDTTSVGEADQELGLYDDARRKYNEAIAYQEKDPGNPDLGETLNDLGLLEFTLCNYDKARRLYERAKPLIEATYGHSSPMFATILDNFAKLSQATGDPSTAETLLNESLGIRQGVPEPSVHDISVGFSNLATVEADLGRLDSAEGLYSKAISLLEHAYPNTPMMTLAVIHINFSVLYRGERKYPQARAENAKAAVILQNFPEGRQLAALLNNVAALASEEGHADLAELHYGFALAMCERVLGPSHPEVAAVASNLAHFYCAHDQKAKAVPLLKRAMVIYGTRFAPRHLLTQGVARELSTVLRSLGRNGEATEVELCINRGALCPSFIKP